MIPASHYKTHNIVTHPGNAIVRTGKDTWVWCVDGKPEKAVFYCGESKRHNSLQGNSDKRIAERIVPALQDIELVLVPQFFIPWRD